MTKTIRALVALVPLAALALAPALTGQDPAKGREAAAAAPRLADGRTDPLASWLEGFFGWGPGDMKM
ncbi:MAG TPA: hypothetical protein PK598_11130, partial [Thermoanaerobaculia bacterium]|nr:hypothetical protein [Thermoanaerobaculia bacterium]